MKKIIVTTTINDPTPAIRKYDSMEDWELLVIADMKTPKDYKLERGTVLWPKDYGSKYFDLIDLIGFNSVRLGRMISFIEAWKRGADIIASIDDDCDPLPNWGEGVVLGEEIEAKCYHCEGICFDPYRPYSMSDVPPRGFPLELQFQRGHFQYDEPEIKKITPLVRVDACAIEADFHAFERLATVSETFVAHDDIYFSDAPFSPINTQNTFIHRDAIKDFYANIPFIGRADDIWAGYIFQSLHPNSTVYGPVSTEHIQNRSVQSLVNDLEDEIFMYRDTNSFLETIVHHGEQDSIDCFMPYNSKRAIQLYRSYFK